MWSFAIIMSSDLISMDDFALGSCLTHVDSGVFANGGAAQTYPLSDDSLVDRIFGLGYRVQNVRQVWLNDSIR